MEYVDIYDDQGRLTGKCRERHEDFAPGEYRLITSLWVINDNGRVLIQRRAASLTFAPNLWTVSAGGSVRAGESSKQGCLREAFEEIGLKLAPGDIKLLGREFKGGAIFDLYATVNDLAVEDAVLEPAEVSEVRWLDIDEVEALAVDGRFAYDCRADLAMVREYYNSHRVIDKHRIDKHR